MFSKFFVFIVLISVFLPFAVSSPGYKCGRKLMDLIFRVCHETCSNGADITQLCYAGRKIDNLQVIQLCCPQQISP
ncbi:hypothetical protein CRE_30147 [Caenorhabditis remanei]|uniref:Uncharacterized protein n=1 Tax=Caenorhabditis remanei TaxID=31234 RepID=E3NAJ1_CAERE|nr:hypothetical protein CRE_30147 [Caenorhabditis remanei]